MRDCELPACSDAIVKQSADFLIFYFKFLISYF
jgi:hypothetical protein